MSVEQNRYKQIEAEIYSLTPLIVKEVEALFEADPDLQHRFGDTLPRLAHQEVTRLRDLLLGAIRYDYPPILGKQYRWLLSVAEVRDFNLKTVREHVRIFRATLVRCLPPGDLESVLKIFDEALGLIHAQVN
ncbi:MAG TPA: hypothetical protein VH186_17695 [Chloroflexia bacterium]|nr:hypothetical protein [Chloroflexia bacterium]